MVQTRFERLALDVAAKRESAVGRLCAGRCADYAQYRELVGFIQAMNGVLQAMDDVSRPIEDVTERLLDLD